jgi:hypothetical protein
MGAQVYGVFPGPARTPRKRRHCALGGRAGVRRSRGQVAAIGQPVHLLGHSGGGILALPGAGSGHHLLSRMLWEPALVVEGAGERPGTGMLAKKQSLPALGDRGELVGMAIRETLELPESEIAALAAGRGWEPLLSLALTLAV